MGIHISGCPFSLEGEGWDEGEYNQLILLSSLQQERELGAVATHCFYCVEKLCRYLCNRSGNGPTMGIPPVNANIIRCKLQAGLICGLNRA
jgi:hypothetical protein